MREFGDFLTQSGVMHFLRQQRIEFNPNDPIEKFAVTAGWTEGFNYALDAIENFEDFFLTDGTPHQTVPEATYGAMERALSTKTLDKKDLEKINGTR